MKNINAKILRHHTQLCQDVVVWRLSAEILWENQTQQDWIQPEQGLPQWHSSSWAERSRSEPRAAPGDGWHTLNISSPPWSLSGPAEEGECAAVLSCFVWCELFVSRLHWGVTRTCHVKVQKVFAVGFSLSTKRKYKQSDFSVFMCHEMKVIGIIYIHTYFDRQGIDK